MISSIKLNNCGCFTNRKLRIIYDLYACDMHVTRSIIRRRIVRTFPFRWVYVWRPVMDREAIRDHRGLSCKESSRVSSPRRVIILFSVWSCRALEGGSSFTTGLSLAGAACCEIEKFSRVLRGFCRQAWARSRAPTYVRSRVYNAGSAGLPVRLWDPPNRPENMQAA